MKVITSLLLALTLAVAGSGCFAVVAGAGAGGTVFYLNGQLKSNESVPMRKAWNATDLSVRELGLVLVGSKHDELSGQIVARNSRDQKVQIDLSSLGSNATEIRIRVGVWGDETASRLILQKIKSHL